MTRARNARGRLSGPMLPGPREGAILQAGRFHVKTLANKEVTGHAGPDRLCSLCHVQPPRPGQRSCKACHAAVMRRTRPAYAELSADEKARASARGIARYAEKTGKLVRTPCDYGTRPGEREAVAPDRKTCGVLEVERHHDDYDKPLEVRYLCKPHHVLADRARKPTQRPLALA